LIFFFNYYYFCRKISITFIPFKSFYSKTFSYDLSNVKWLLFVLILNLNLEKKTRTKNHKFCTKFFIFTFELETDIIINNLFLYFSNKSKTSPLFIMSLSKKKFLLSLKIIQGMKRKKNKFILQPFEILS
jgi:hypothetical protein